jgi:hypothetical protein
MMLDRGYDAGHGLSRKFNSHPDILEAQQGHLDGRLAIRRDSILNQGRTAKDLEDIALDVLRGTENSELDDTAASRRHGHL